MNLGLSEMVFIFLLALVLVGPSKLPEVARQLGKFLAEFKRASNEFKHQLETEMLNIELEERAKNAQESPRVLPPEEPWQRVMRPLAETVSRSTSELVAVVSSEPEPTESAVVSVPQVEQHSSPATSSGPK